MPVTVQVPFVLRPCCNGAAELTCPGSTAREVLEHLERAHPELYRSVCNETGAIRQHMNLFINESLVADVSQLDAALRSGDVVSIFQAVSGG